jgi:hypothetical protein
MDETRQSLLLRAQTGETDAWRDLTDLYRPLILSWLNRQGVPGGDLEDLSQEVLLSVVKHLPGFQHSGHPGAFRSWLRTSSAAEIETLVLPSANNERPRVPRPARRVSTRSIDTPG